MEIFLGICRITHDHGKITFTDTLCGYCQVFSWPVRNVSGVKRGWFIVFSCIYPEQAKISGMPWPYPVIRISTEFSYRGWRGSDQSYVLKYFVNKEKIIASKEEGFNFGFVMRIFNGIGNDFPGIPVNGLIPLLF